MNKQFQLSQKLNEKLLQVKKIITSYEKVAIAFSAGVDSTLLLKIASDTLKDNVLPITVKAAMMPESEYLEVLRLARQMGVRPLILETDIFLLNAFIENKADRCYHCKRYIFQLIKKAAMVHGFAIILDGSNVDDQLDYRPGLKALSELKIISPFKDVGLTKDEIRALSNYYQLETAKKPAMACLATRIPTATKITKEALSLIEAGEEILKALDLKQYRLRLIGGLAKIECQLDDFEIILKNRKQLIFDLKKIGFQSIALDLDGYKQGKMNRLEL